MTENAEELEAEILEGFWANDLTVRVRPDGHEFVAELCRRDGSIVWPDFAGGPTELLAILCAEQRYLVEEVGHGSCPGDTYAEKARVRLARWFENHGQQT